MREFRELHFSNHEVFEALRTFKAKDVQIPDASEILTISLTNTQTVTLHVHLNSPGAEGLSQIEFPSSFVAAMMLSYCIHRKVPVPKKSQKNLSLTDGNLVMSFRG